MPSEPISQTKKSRNSLVTKEDIVNKQGKLRWHLDLVPGMV